MGIIINMCYSEVTPESAENGDYSDTGIIEEYEEYTFTDLYHKLKNGGFYYNGSWFETYPYITDYSTATERTESIHFSLYNDERMKKYWNKLINALPKR